MFPASCVDQHLAITLPAALCNLQLSMQGLNVCFMLISTLLLHFQHACVMLFARMSQLDAHAIATAE